MKKRLWFVLIVLLAVISVPVFAEENFEAGNNVEVKENKEATSFIAGNIVDLNSEIDGVGFIAGNIVTVSSSQDYLFAAGNNVTVNKASGKDMFIAGNSLMIKDTVVRDLYMAGTTLKIDTRVSRNLYAAGDSIYINSEIDGDVYLASEQIKLGENAIITGTLKYPEDAKMTIAESAIVGKKKTYKGDTTSNHMSILDGIIIPTIIAYISMLLIAFVLMFLNKKLYDKFTKINKENKDLLKHLGIGFVGLIMIPTAAVLVMITIIGFPLSIIALIIYSILIYLSVIPTAYVLGTKFLKDKIKNKYLLLAVSLLIIYLLKAIPLLGGIVELLIICLGLGIYLILLKETIHIK